MKRQVCVLSGSEAGFARSQLETVGGIQSQRSLTTLCAISEQPNRSQEIWDFNGARDVPLQVAAHMRVLGGAAAAVQR